MYYIYALCSSNDFSNIRYIGVTNNPDKRLKSHLNKFWLKANTHKVKWINNCLAMGYSVQMKIVESNIDTLKMAFEAEVFYIKYFKNLGYDLTNGTIGGDGNNRLGTKHSEESKQKMSNSQKGKIRSQELKDLWSKIKIGKQSKLRGCTIPEEVRQKISISVSLLPHVICPHCQREMPYSNAIQWHFDKCKLNPNPIKT